MKIYKLVSNAKQGLFALALVVSGKVYAQVTYTLNYTGSVQTQTLPAGLWSIECWGADGGEVTAGPGGGGKGGYSKGELSIAIPGTVLNIFVGGKGNSATGSSAAAGAGGWNGGGGGAAVGRSGAGGGGATDVRVGGTAATDRVIVAGGGGGAAYYSVSPFVAPGGNGGGQIGQDGSNITSGGVLTVGSGGGAGANGATPGLAAVGTANGTASGGGGGGSSAGASVGQPGVGGGYGGAAGPSAGGSTGSSGGGGGGYAGGAGGVQTSNAGVAGGGGSGYVGGVSNGTTVSVGQPSFVINPDVTANGMVIITELCNISLVAAKNPICIGESVVLSTDALSPISWSTGGTTSSVVVSPTTTTSYSVTGTGTNVCVTTVVIQVSVTPLPIISAMVNPPLVCAGSPATLTGVGANTYTWNAGPTGTTTLVSPLVSTVYNVSGTDGFGCIGTTTVNVAVNTNVISVSANTTICSGESINISASGAITYMWSNGFPNPSLIVSPTVSTVYSVLGTDANNCVLSNSISVTVNPAPNVLPSSDKDVICKRESVVLTASGANTYAWTNPITGSSTGASVTLTLNIDVPYTFTVTGTDANGCSKTATLTVDVQKCTGISEVGTQTNFVSVYPNPTSGLVTIETKNSNSGTIEIMDLSGKVVLTTNYVDGKTQISLSELSNGVYLAKLGTGTSYEIIKIIKNNN